MANVNGLYGVPWMLDGGRHVAELGRLIAHAASRGGEGVILPSDLKVTARATPTTVVDMAPGAVFIPQRAAGASSQSYVAWAPQPSAIDGPPSNPAARSYLILVSIKDPQYPGGMNYTEGSVERKLGPFVFPELYGPVPAGTTKASQIPELAGKAVYAPARLDVPANTTAIAPAHIVDLRRLNTPQSLLELESAQLEEATNAIDLAEGVFKNWPTATFPVPVPDWATHMTVKIDFSGITRDGGDVKAAIRATMGTFWTSSDLYVLFAAATNGGNSRESFMITGRGAIPPEVRGTTQVLRTQGARMTPSTHPGYLRASPGGQISWMVSFRQQVI